MVRLRGSTERKSWRGNDDGKKDQRVCRPAGTRVKKTVCTHCSVGCTFLSGVAAAGEVAWSTASGSVQEPGWDSPFNLGAHCAKGAAVREHAHGERRLKYPMKLVNGKWKRMSWERRHQRDRRPDDDDPRRSGPDSVYWLGSAKHNNEQAYLFRKFAAFWGTNNVDHQARICHSTTVAGVANTWGYGAMTNSYNDIHNSRAIFIIGGNPAEAHPVSLLHVLKAKEAEQRSADRLRPALHAHRGPRRRICPLPSGHRRRADLGYSLAHLRERLGRQGVHPPARLGHGQIKEEVAKWTRKRSKSVTGVPGSQLEARCAHAGQQPSGHRDLVHGRHPAHQRQQQHPRLLRAAAGARQHGQVAGGGTNIFRGHDNVQGATDLGVLSHTLPGYYGLSDGAWKHWARVWDVDFDWLDGRFAKMTGKDGKDRCLNENRHSGVALDRRCPGRQGQHRSAGQRPGHGASGVMRRTPRPACRT
jgi:formate dehydrogenase major subunit